MSQLPLGESPALAVQAAHPLLPMSWSVARRQRLQTSKDPIDFILWWPGSSAVRSCTSAERGRPKWLE